LWVDRFDVAVAYYSFVKGLKEFAKKPCFSFVRRPSEASKILLETLGL